MEKPKTIQATCQATKPDGSRCRAAALAGSAYCFFHDPSMAEERRAAQSFGGSQNRMKTLDADAPDRKVEDLGSVVGLMSETINQVRKGQIDPRVANAIGYLANVLIKAVEGSSLEDRLAEMEALVKGRPMPGADFMTLAGSGS